MNSPFVHLRCFIQDLSTSRNGEGGSEQIREGASNFYKTSQNPKNLEELLAGLRFKWRKRLDLILIKLSLSESLLQLVASHND